MKIYVASSWRNYQQPGIVRILAAAGHEVYDFRNPPNKSGFGWEQIGGLPKPCSGARLREAWKHPIAQAGYTADIGALRDCEAVVLVLPAGRSASWEFGYAMGQGKRGYVVQFSEEEPELMFCEATMLTSVDEVFAAFGEPKPDNPVNVP